MNTAVETSSNRLDRIFQIRFRNRRRGVLEIFWAEQLVDSGTSFRFKHCRIMRIATIENTGLFKPFYQMVTNISLPCKAGSIVVIEVNRPEWWHRTREEAEAELKRMAKDPVAIEIGRTILPFTRDLEAWLQRYSLTDAPRSEQERKLRTDNLISQLFDSCNR